VTVFLAAIGVAVTIGALVIGLVALKTLREIKSEAASAAKDAAGEKIKEMAQKRELDVVLERAAVRVQSGGTESAREEDYQD